MGSYSMFRCCTAVPRRAGRLWRLLSTQHPLPLDNSRESSSSSSSTQNRAAVSNYPGWENYNLPNFLSVARAASAPIVGWTLLTEQYDAAVALLAIAALSDVADGWCARNLQWPLGGTSTLGVYLDPVGDKLLVAAVALPLTFSGHLPLWLTGLVVGRDVAIVGIGLVFRWFKAEKGRFFDPSDAGGEQLAVIEPTLLSKVNTALTFSLLGATLLEIGWGLDSTAVGASVLAHLPYVTLAWNDGAIALVEHGVGASSAQALHTGACVVFGTTLTSGSQYALRAIWLKWLQR